MVRRPPRSTRTDTLFPYTTLFRSVSFHLPLLARRGLAPYGEVAGVALARDRIDAGMSRVVAPAGKRAIIRHAAAVEIKAAFQFVAMGVRDLLRNGDHQRHIVCGDRTFAGRYVVEVREVALEGVGIMGS